MLRFLTAGILTRGAARKLSRAIPNPLVRALAIAAAGYAIERAVYRGWRRRQAHA